MLGAGIAALARNGASEALGGQLGFSRDMLTLRKQGAHSSLKVNGTGKYILSVVDLGTDPPRKVRSPVASASYFELVFANGRPNLPNDGLRPPDRGDGLFQFEPPMYFFGL